MANHVVIMAGGIGSRFWPLSTPEFPKQFIDILGCGRTLIQLTVDRFKGICSDDNFWVVTNKAYVDIVKEQIPGIPSEHILAEPAARNTAPCIAWACWSIKQEDPDANVVVTPSDAVVMNTVEFQRVIRGALAFTAGHDFIVTIGIKPNRPETGYGYIMKAEVGGRKAEVGGLKEEVGSMRSEVRSKKEEVRGLKAEVGGLKEEVGSRKAEVGGLEAEVGGLKEEVRGVMDDGGVEIMAVEEFKEKPDLETAKRYLADGNYLWNAGIFVWNVRTITDSIRAYKPVLAEQMDKMVPLGEVLGRAKRQSRAPFGTVSEKKGPNGTVPNGTVLEIFPGCEKISIDYAVMEPAATEGKVFTCPADFGWSDLGNWQSLHEKLQKDDDDNASVGNVHFYESSNCVVHCEDAKKVVIQGLDGYIVSLKNGQLLVCRRSEEQRIKVFGAE